MVHRQPIKVRFYELDPYNHLNHSAYIQYFEVGRVELLEEAGLGLSDLQNRGRHVVVTGIETRFLTPAHAHDELIVETRLREMKRVSAVWEQRLLRGDEVLATQVVSTAMTDTSGRPVRFPPELVEALAGYRSDGP